MNKFIFIFSLLTLTATSLADEIQLKSEATCTGRITLGQIADLSGTASQLASKEIALDGIQAGKTYKLSRQKLLAILSGPEHRDVNWGVLLLRGSQTCEVTLVPEMPKIVTSHAESTAPVEPIWQPQTATTSKPSTSVRRLAGANLGLTVFDTRFPSQGMSIRNTHTYADRNSGSGNVYQPQRYQDQRNQDHARHHESGTIETQMKRLLIGGGHLKAGSLDSITIKTDHVHEPWLGLPYSPESMRLSLNPRHRDARYKHGFALSYEDSAGLVQQVTIPVNSRRYVTIYELAYPLERGAILSQHNLKAVNLPESSLKGSEILDIKNALGKTLKRGKKSGHPLLVSDITPQKLVKRGDLVSVYARQGYLLVKTVGLAQGEGALGQTITVRNENNRETFLARVTGPRQVTVSPKG